MKRPAGYSGNPLATKLGLKQGFRISLSRDPRHYSSLLGQLPVGTKRLAPGATNLDFLHIFVTSSAELLHDLPRAKLRIKPDGMLWISWPKRTSAMKTDLDENVVRQVGLDNGLVDVKVAAIDEVWFGLKFFYGLRDRP